MKNKKVTLIIGGIFMAITVLLFLIRIKDGKRTIDYIALFCVLLGEVLAFGTAAYSMQSTTISQLAVSSVSGVYLFINIAFSVLFKNAFKNDISSFLIFHIIFVCIAAVAIIVLSGVLKNINKDTETVLQQKAVIDECERVANILAQNDKFKNNKQILNQIYDEIKYNDHISDYKSGEILSALNEIYNAEGLSDDEIQKLCQKAYNLVQERNITVKQLKRGGF